MFIYSRENFVKNYVSFKLELSKSYKFDKTTGWFKKENHINLHVKDAYISIWYSLWYVSFKMSGQTILST